MGLNPTPPMLLERADALNLLTQLAVHGTPVDALLAHLLGRHVVGRAGGDVVALAVLRVVLVGDAGDAEVEHLGLGAPDHEDVGRLDVAAARQDRGGIR